MAAIELGCPYKFYSSDLSDNFVLNDPTDPNFVGYVTDITGLDDAGVRENAQVVVAGDGGYHGPFWQDRRPWTFSGIIMPTMPVISRDAAQEHIQKVLGTAMRQDGYLTWTPADGITRFLPYRKQQPMRIATGQSKVEKTFQLAAVSADYRIYNYAQSVVSQSGASPLNMAPVTNLGNADAPFTATITGPMNTFALLNLTTGKRITVNYNLLALDAVVLDLTGTYPTVTEVDFSGNIYGSVDPLLSDWTLALAPGVNVFQLLEAVPGTYAGSPTSNSSSGLQLQWRDAWL